MTEHIVLCSAGDGHLAAIVDGETIPVRLRQCFPWSEPRRHLSLRDGDDREVALVEDPAALPAASRAALERALAESGFVLRVTRVRSIDEEVEIRHWSVDTAQGPRTFQTHLDEWPQALPSGGLLVRDVAGDLYHLPAPAELDAHSRRLLWAYVD
ncbi:protein of unknown function DUF1854 (plasmid) [Gemmatirosa kalamazoonensis]|uniref:DUF1854 domain-containing protein n=1 Tax=Gemmatirosa kalamazoonensis TaxID=861299 RepID=W0RPK3_9BACT|nr:DUF1854 domain-containing protein [Gemmatirosa kalamazoonensis]AHG92934.1 protein of unknown function DUF1854 [Gemmatirosa kalamazoonensis]